MKSLEFKKELEQLINKYSVENGSDTPDLILANYLMNCLQSFEIAIDSREKWYGRKEENDQIGFKEIKDCKWNKNDEYMTLNKSNSGLEKIIKYCSMLNNIFGHPYYFTWSLATNYYDRSPVGQLKDPGYASFRVGRYLANGKPIEKQLIFAPINGIVDYHKAIRCLFGEEHESIVLGFTPIQILEIKKLIDDLLQKDSGIPWEEFMVVPPKDETPLDNPPENFYGWDWTKGDIKDE